MFISKGKFFQIKGPASISLDSGKVESMGFLLKPGDCLNIPRGKGVPVNIIEDCRIKIALDQGGELKEHQESSIPDSWEELITRLIEEGVRILLVLGVVDTGKSFFSTYLANCLMDKGKRVSVLDCDIGQSDIGPPGTLGLAILKEPIIFLSQAPVDHIYMVGGHAPGEHFLPMLTGIQRLKEHALEESDILIVDTTGWVHGNGGRALKRAKIEILQPRIIVLLERERELEHLVSNPDKNRIVRLKVSRRATPTSAADRQLLRQLISKRYFQGGKVHSLAFSAVSTDRAFLGTGKPVDKLPPGCLWAEELPAYEPLLVVLSQGCQPRTITRLKEKYGEIRIITVGKEQGVMVGLLDKEGETRGLGIIESIDYSRRRYHIYTPLTSIKDISTIQFSSLRYTLSGEEAGFVQPGYF